LVRLPLMSLLLRQQHEEGNLRPTTPLCKLADNPSVRRQPPFGPVCWFNLLIGRVSQQCRCVCIEKTLHHAVLPFKGLCFFMHAQFVPAQQHLFGCQIL